MKIFHIQIIHKYEKIRQRTRVDLFLVALTMWIHHYFIIRDIHSSGHVVVFKLYDHSTSMLEL